MTTKKMDENKLDDISGGIDNVDKALLTGAAVSTTIATINWVRRWRKSDKESFWGKYKDAVGLNTMIPAVIGGVLSYVFQYRNNPYQN